MICKFGLGVMSSKYEEYCRNAMVCESMSHTTSSQSIRASWLKLAESWLRMIPEDSSLDETTHKSFDLAAQRTGTGQENSKRSH
ncbi:MAG: hypothetical protein QOF03_74 [Alphaproteobacteria bacterium]|jgi:hypothetical protein|nr:hypothetical protein [Alphaproteobacteria bacterium]